MKSAYDNLRSEPSLVVALIAAAVAAALALFFANAGDDLARAAERAEVFLLLGVCAVAFQLVVIPLPVGAASFASAPILAAGFLFGPAAAMVLAAAAGVTRYVASRGLLHRAAFDVSDFALAAAAGSGLYWAAADQPRWLLVAVAAGAGLAYWLVNVALLSVAISLSTGAGSSLELLRERYGWLWPYMVVTSWLALSAVFVVEHGPLLVAASLLPAMPLALLAKAWHGRSAAA